MGNQLFNRSLTQSRRGNRFKFRCRNPVNPSSIPTTGQVQVGNHIVGNVNCFQYFPVEIKRIESPIGCVDEIDWTKPGIGRSNNLSLLVDALRFERNTVRHQSQAMNQIGLGAPDEQGPSGFRRQDRSAVHCRTGTPVKNMMVCPSCRSSPLTQGHAATAPNDSPGFQLTNSKDGRYPAAQIIDTTGNRQVRITPQVLIGQDHVMNRVSLATEKPVVPVVERVTELGATAERL